MIEYIAPVDGFGRRIGIVVSRFNGVVTQELLKGALECLREFGVADDDIVVAWVPGAWEIPSALAWLGQSGKFDALIALGAIIRGETPHFDYVAAGCTDGVGEVARSSGLPIAFGVLTTNDLEQALARTGAKPGSTNKGWEAAATALEMLNLREMLSK
jgi:6,7-dimethyl-8-ribityllumazine synthase